MGDLRESWKATEWWVTSVRDLSREAKGESILEEIAQVKAQQHES